jgi:hypothetical protein
MPRGFMRYLLPDVDLDFMFLGPRPPRWDEALVLDTTAQEARRAVMLGAARAARAALDRRDPADRDGPVCIAPAAAVEAAFAATLAAPVRLDILLAAFVPTTLLYESDLDPRGHDVVCCRDGAVPSDVAKALLHVDSDRLENPWRVRGETLFLPPVGRGEGRRRAAWVRQQELELPSLQNGTDPFARMGRARRWKADLLGWHERLVLAGVLAAHSAVTVVVGPERRVPRIGWAVETARQLGRTIVGVPMDLLPGELRAALEAARERPRTGRMT